MLERVLIAGTGGQGVVLAGKILATAAVDVAPHVTFFPDYGAEVRGGTSKCEIILSSDEIASPVSHEFESMLFLNQASVDKFLPQAVSCDLVILNSSLCSVPPDIGESAVAVPATELAGGLGDARSANLVMLGAYLARKPLVPPGRVMDELRSMLAGKGEALLQLTVKALDLGLNS